MDAKTPQPRTITFDTREYALFARIAKQFLEQGMTSEPPKFVIFMGGIGVGKTTIRRQKYTNGYVHFDFGEIYLVVEKWVSKHHPRLAEYAAFTSDLILRESISEKKNIVIEIIGDSQAFITPVIEKMENAGYDVEILAITADVAEAYKRHLKAVEEDKDYISAYHTQEATLSSFYNYFGLQMPLHSE